MSWYCRKLCFWSRKVFQSKKKKFSHWSYCALSWWSWPGRKAQWSTKDSFSTLTARNMLKGYRVLPYKIKHMLWFNQKCMTVSLSMPTIIFNKPIHRFFFLSFQLYRSYSQGRNVPAGVQQHFHWSWCWDCYPATLRSSCHWINRQRSTLFY